MLVGRFAVRASVLVACVVFTGSGLLGKGAGVGAAPVPANSQTVQVEYKGTETAATVLTFDNRDTSKVETTVSKISWDLVWSGPLDQLILPLKYSSNPLLSFVPRTLTGTTKVTWPPPYDTRNCTASLSLNPADVAPLASGLANGGSDSSRIVLGAYVPENILRSSGTGDCNAHSYSSGATDLKNRKLPKAVFSLTNLGKKQSESFSGIDISRWPHSVDTTVINSSITFAGAACTGAGGSSDQDRLFGCYVALGDSYSAGQIPPFVPGGEACLRSTRAYAYLYDKHVAFAACSGAKIGDVLNTQLIFVLKTTKLVSITISGNDSGIIGTLSQCVTQSFSLNRCENAYPAPNFADLHARLVSLYGVIHSRAPNAQIIVLGYPIALPAKRPSDCLGLLLPNTRIGVFASDVPYFYMLLTKLNDTIHRAAQDSGVATFVSPDPLFAGHDACGKSSYFFPLALFSNGQTLHPNAEGHAQLAALLRSAAGPPPD